MESLSITMLNLESFVAKEADDEIIAPRSWQNNQLVSYSQHGNVGKAQPNEESAYFSPFIARPPPLKKRISEKPKKMP